MKNELLIIGGASADILHTVSGKVASAGGAGMYTAMSAHRCGTSVALFAPRPSPMPPALQPVFDRLSAWLGPVIPQAELAHFEISYQDGHATYLAASVGAEASLSPASLPEDLSSYGCIHVIPLGAPSRQLDFVRACRQRGARRISIGNYIHPILSEPQLVRQMIHETDFCFMNEAEAVALFGSLEASRTEPGKLLFVTLGSDGCLVIQGEHMTRLDTRPVSPIDPTGAGDTFCGAVLSGLIHGMHPIMAARAALPLAAQMIQYNGREALLWNEAPPEIFYDERASINRQQVIKIAQMIAGLTEVQPFDFVGPEYPPEDHPAALDLFFASTLQQFGFWTDQDGHYHQPLIAPIGGGLQKGSSYLAHVYLRALQEDPGIFAPARQAQLDEAEAAWLYRAEDGSEPMPALDLHLAQARQYGRDMLALGLTPAELIRLSRASETPLQTFLGLLDQIGGYKEDPLRKKSSLLALILSQRPERFISFGMGEAVAPVIDYHLMRSCLRTGLLDVQDGKLMHLLASRQVVSPEDEWAVRWAAYRAIQQVVQNSGKSMGAVDWFFFNARRRCPEMSEPVCAECAVDLACAHHKQLFQPVIRTVFY